MSEELILKKGGKLYEKKGEERTCNVTKYAFRYLFEYCELDSDVTLRDVFLLLKSNIKMFDLILGNWCSQVVAQGLSKRKREESEIYCLELSFSVQEEGSEKYGYGTHGLGFPDFGGVAIRKKDDAWGCGKAGEDEKYSVSLSSPHNLANLPLRIAKEVEIYKDHYDYDNHKSGYKVIDTFRNPRVTLGQILHGIIWELSWHGSPEKVQEFKKELFRSVDEIKERYSTTEPLEDVKAKLEEKIKNTPKKKKTTTKKKK